jgi:hypothetical protein
MRSPKRDEWQQMMEAIASEEGGISVTRQPDETVILCAQHLAAEKYSSAAYNQKR